MVNLMSVDAQRLMDLTTYVNVLWSSPLTILISLYFLYDVMGPSTLAGVGVLVLLTPINLIVSRIARKLQVNINILFQTCVHNSSAEMVVSMSSASDKFIVTLVNRL